MRSPTHPYQPGKGRLASVPMIGEAAWRILLFLTANAKDDPVEGEVGRAGTIAISDAALAKEVGFASRTVREAVPRLVSIGALGVSRTKGRTTVYTVYPRWAAEDTTPLPTRRAVYEDGTGWVAEDPEPNGLAREVYPRDIPERRRSTREITGQPRRSTREVYRESPLARAHVQNERYTRDHLASIPNVKDNVIPLVLGGAGVEPPRTNPATHSRNARPDTHEPPAPVAPAPDNNKQVTA